VLSVLVQSTLNARDRGVEGGESFLSVMGEFRLLVMQGLGLSNKLRRALVVGSLHARLQGDQSCTLAVHSVLVVAELPRQYRFHELPITVSCRARLQRQGVVLGKAQGVLRGIHAGRSKRGRGEGVGGGLRSLPLSLSLSLRPFSEGYGVRAAPCLTQLSRPVSRVYCPNLCET